MLFVVPPTGENQTEKTTEHEMDTGFYSGSWQVYLGLNMGECRSWVSNTKVNPCVTCEQRVPLGSIGPLFGDEWVTSV